MDFSWEIDLWGHVRRTVESAGADTEAQKALLAQAQLSSEYCPPVWVAYDVVWNDIWPDYAISNLDVMERLKAGSKVPKHLQLAGFMGKTAM